MIEASKNAILERIPYIWYPVWFKNNQNNMKTLIDLGSKVNAMNPVYAKKLGFCVR